MLFFFAETVASDPANVVIATAEGTDAAAALVSRDPHARFRDVPRGRRVLPRLIRLSVDLAISLHRGRLLWKRIDGALPAIWKRFLERYGETWCVCRIEDDFGFKTSLLMRPDTHRGRILPQYRRLIDLVHFYNRPFLLHSCVAMGSGNRIADYVPREGFLAMVETVREFRNEKR